MLRKFGKLVAQQVGQQARFTTAHRTFSSTKALHKGKLPEKPVT